MIAATGVAPCIFPLRALEMVVSRMPSIGQRLPDMTTNDLDAAIEWMMPLGRKTPRERIGSPVLLMARRAAASGRQLPSRGVRCPMWMTREGMANHLGPTIETVCRQLSILRREGLIEIEAGWMVCIPDLSRIEAKPGSAISA